MKGSVLPVTRGRWPGRGEQAPKRVSFTGRPLLVSTSLRDRRDGTGHLGMSPTLSPCWFSLPLVQQMAKIL